MKKHNTKIVKNNSYLEKKNVKAQKINKPIKINKYKSKSKSKSRDKDISKETKTLSISIENQNNISKSSKRNIKEKIYKKYKKIDIEKLKTLSSPNVKSTNKKTIKNIIDRRKLIIDNRIIINHKNNQPYYNTTTNAQSSSRRPVFKTSSKENNDKENEEKKSEEKDKENTKIIINNDYGFNLYNYLKENMKNEKDLCQDNITKNSLYCLDCNISTCPKCSTFYMHQTHNNIYTYSYYFEGKQKLDEYFNDIDCLFSLNPYYLDINKLKGELKIQLTNQINQIIDKLNEIKNNKLKEIDNLIDGNENKVELLKNKKDKIKNDINDLLEKHKFFLNFKNDNDINGEINNDKFNASFLIRYDLLKNIEFINEKIKSIILDIKSNAQEYLDEFNKKINGFQSIINNLIEGFEGEFKFKDLNCDLYKPIEEKLMKYSHKIDLIKKKIYDKVNKKGGFDNIQKANKILNESLKRKYFNLFDLDYNNKSRKTTIDIKTMKKYKTPEELRLDAHSKKLVENNTLSSDTPRKIFNSINDVCLNSKYLQDFYTFEIINMMIINNFANNQIQEKSPNKTEIEEDNEIYDKIQPIPGTNEIQIFKKKSGTIIKKNVKFNNSSHKYSYFLNGCRSILINDSLFIFGGVSKEKTESKISYIYSIKNNELSLIPEMSKPHSYHSLYYIDNYNSILVIGGEYNNSCELFNINTNTWVNLPDMNYSKANCSIYFDKTHEVIYTFFGKSGKITDRDNYLDVIESLDFRQFPLEWKKIKYNNKAEMNVKNEYIKISPISDDMIIINGGKNGRCIYLINKKEIVKFNRKIYEQIIKNYKNSEEIMKILLS